MAGSGIRILGVAVLVALVIALVLAAVVLVGRGDDIPESTADSPRVASSRIVVNLNSASAEVLAQVPGIGPVEAKAIVNYREENGCFQREEDLIRVKGIDTATLEKFLDLVFADECR